MKILLNYFYFLSLLSIVHIYCSKLPWENESIWSALERSN